MIDSGLLAIAGRGAAYSAADYIAAGTARADFGAVMDTLLNRFDALVSPATAIQPLPAGALVPENFGQQYWHQWAGCSFPINLTQQPACVIPHGTLPNGIPASLQIIGARMQDAALLDIAAAINGLDI